MAYKFKFNKNIKEMKKILKKTLFVLMLSAIVFNFSSCGDDDEESSGSYEKILTSGQWWCESDYFEVNYIEFYKDHTGYVSVDWRDWRPSIDEEFDFNWSIKGDKLTIKNNSLNVNIVASIKSLTNEKCVVVIEGKRFEFYNENEDDEYYYYGYK